MPCCRACRPNDARLCSPRRIEATRHDSCGTFGCRAKAKPFSSTTDVHYAPVAGTKLHYRMDGTRGKPVLVLSNSLGTDLAMWEPQIAALRPHFCILRYDTRGHGA